MFNSTCSDITFTGETWDFGERKVKSLYTSSFEQPLWMLFPSQTPGYGNNQVAREVIDVNDSSIVMEAPACHHDPRTNLTLYVDWISDTAASRNADTSHFEEVINKGPKCPFWGPLRSSEGPGGPNLVPAAPWPAWVGLMVTTHHDLAGNLRRYLRTHSGQKSNKCNQ